MASFAVPAYQTLSPWDLLRIGNNAWRHPFPFSAEKGLWTFSGRVALNLGLPTLGLRPASAILVPNYCQGVEIDTLRHNGYRPKFYRIDKNLQVDLDDVKMRLGSDVGAMHVTHYFGWPQDMASISAFCREHGLKLIEDCALALFSRDEENWLGTYGNLSLFSVYKTLPLPHGGYLVTKATEASGYLKQPPFISTLTQLSDLVYERLKQIWGKRVGQSMRHLSSFARRLHGGDRGDTVSSGGAYWDSRLLEFRASRLVPYLMKTVHPDRVIAARRRNFLRLAERLKGRYESPIRDLPEGVCPLFFPVMVRDKLRAMAYMKAQDIGTINVWWDPHPSCPEDLAEEVAYLRRHLLELPIHQSLSLEDVDRVAEVYLKFADRG